MIVNFKLFEKLEIDPNGPQVGDYVIIDMSELMTHFPQMVTYFNNSIGKIINIELSPLYNFEYFIFYDNLPKEFEPDLQNSTLSVMKDSIKYHSSNKEDLEVILDTRKYNI